jgi:hypothetical protein
MTLYWPPPEHIDYLTDRRPPVRKAKRSPIRRSR